jgi:DNA-binding MarR family transcriptional regulator
MRTFRVGNTHLTILESLSGGRPIRKIAASLGLNPSSVLRDIRQMEKRGYIARLVRSHQVLYTILPSGQELMQHPVREFLTGGSINATPPEKPEYKIRLHRLQVKYDLVNPVKDPRVISFRDHPSKIVPMGPKGSAHWNKNIIQFEDFTCIISTKSIIIAGIQRYLTMHDNIESQEAAVLSEISPFVEQVEEKIRRMEPGFQILRKDGSGPIDLDKYDLTPIENVCYDLISNGKREVKQIHAALKEKKFDISLNRLNDILTGLAGRGLLSPVGGLQGFQLKRLDRGVLSGTILAREYAFEDHHLAKLTGPMRIDAPDGKPRIIVDKSKGPLEIEFVHKDTAPQDSEQMRKNDLILATNDLGDALQALKTQVSVVTELTKHAATAQDQMDQVISGLGQISNILGTMWRP